MFLHLDCRHYLGDRPCRFHRQCQDCPHFEPMGPRVLIVKLGALGDVVRTGCLLPALSAWREPPHVTWLTAPAARPLVERMKGVHRVLPFDAASLAHLELESFDTILSLDKEPAPCAVAMRVRAEHRLGMGLSRYGTVYPLNEECEYYFSLGLDDDEKFFRNQKSYPQLLFEALGWPWRGERYELTPTADDAARAEAALRELGVPAGAPLVGINPGAGHIFAHKAWREEGYRELIHELKALRPEACILLLGGADEAELLGRLARTGGERVFLPPPGGPLGDFIALVARLDVLVCGDTLALHLAVAQRRRVVAIFGPTCEQEIDLYGLGEKIVTPIGCSPCYLRHCEKSPHCQDLNQVETVLAATLLQLETK